LFVLGSVDAARAWYIEHGRLSAARTKQLSRTINELCGVLRPHATTLVDAFGCSAAWEDLPLLRFE
jgi:acyl-CoA oxidase